MAVVSRRSTLAVLAEPSKPPTTSQSPRPSGRTSASARGVRSAGPRLNVPFAGW
jgi:hypothetical protein